MTNSKQNDEFYQNLHSLQWEMPSKEEFAKLSKDQKAEVISKLEQSGRKVREISEMTGYAVSSVYKLRKHSQIPETVELENLTFLENFIARREMLQDRIRELSRILEQEVPVYVDKIDEDTGDEYREIIRGNPSKWAELARVRLAYETQLLTLEQKSAILPSASTSAYNTISQSKPEELAKEDVENLTDTELLMKLVADLKRNGKSGSLASLKDEKILGD